MVYNISIIMRFLPLLILTGLLFGQDVLVAVNAEEYEGKFVDIKRFIIAKDKDYVLFKFDDRSLEFLMNEKIEKEWLYHNNTAQQLQKIPTRLIKEIRLADGEILKSQACIFSSKKSKKKKGLKSLIRLLTK